MADLTFRLEITWGHVEIGERMVPHGRDIVFESRKRHVSLDGVAGEWSAWEPTGCRLVAPPVVERVKPWWKFWGVK